MRTFINDLKPAEFIQGVFAIQNCQLASTKGGKPYLKMLLGDKTGRTPGRMWNTTEEIFNGLPTDGFVHIEGQTQPYQGEMQIIVNQIVAYHPTPDEMRDLLPSTTQDIDTMFGQLVRLLDSIEHPAVGSLRDRYLEDGDLMDAFCQAPAASSLHHAFLGGLLEHTWQLLRSADALLPLYPQVNRDIVLMGLFLHDLGKCKELEWTNGFSYSTDGQLVGHIARGVTMLHDKCKACEPQGADDEGIVPVPLAIKRVLEHIILSHHGVPEYGALKIPATPEAIFVSNLDHLDAKMNLVLAAAGRDSDDSPTDKGDFSEKIWALDTRVYRPDPTTVNE